MVLREHCAVLDLRDLRPTRDTLTWKGAAPGFYVKYRLLPGGVRLGFPDGVLQTIDIVTEPLPNGGWRRYFVCDGRRARKLYLTPDGDVFRSRAEAGVTYLSRVVHGRARAELREARILEKIGFGGQVVRPSWVRPGSWSRLVARLETVRAQAGTRRDRPGCRRGAAVTNARRCACECGFVSNPGNVARHRRARGHVGTGER